MLRKPPSFSARIQIRASRPSEKGQSCCQAINIRVCITKWKWVWLSSFSA
jgi:hypothetical protein